MNIDKLKFGLFIGFQAGIMVTMSVIGLSRDILGKNAYFSIISEMWVDWKISVPIHIVGLVMMIMTVRYILNEVGKTKSFK